MLSKADPTYLGEVTGVTGGSITVRLADSLASGLAVIRGQTYRVAQVGSFVRIPQGYQDLIGVVCEVGASISGGEQLTKEYGGRWMRVELVGETIGGQFERGLSQHPNIRDAVHLVTQQDLRRVYGSSTADEVVVGVLASAENISVSLSLDSLVTRHSAVLGSTGSGKSTTVASLLRSILEGGSGRAGSEAARILLIDIHGEYASALDDFSRVFSATPELGERPLYVPFWALNARELLELLVGPLDEKHAIAFEDKVLSLKSESLAAHPLAGAEPDAITVDSAIPFSLKRLWHELIDFETMTLGGPQRNVPQQLAAGDADRLVAPTYEPHGLGTSAPFVNTQAKGIRRQLNQLRSRLLDRRYDFLLRPGDWEPDLTGGVRRDLDSLLEGWLGFEKPLTILDLSGVPSAVLDHLVGSILRIAYDAMFWSREKSEGGIKRPLLIVMEEAHRYLGDERSRMATEMVRRIAKEGRKYGVGAMIVSQRPSEIDETILSQCGTIAALRLSNPGDRQRVKGALPDNLASLTDLLPVLRTGEAIIVGEAAKLPVRCRIKVPAEGRRPNSFDPEVSAAWAKKRMAEGYDRVVASMRAQRTRAVARPVSIAREPIDDPEEGEET